MTHIMSHEFQVCDSRNRMTCLRTYYWLRVIAQMTHMGKVIDCIVQPFMSNHADWVTNID